MNINLTVNQNRILDQIIEAGYAFDRESAIYFLIQYYDLLEDKRLKSLAQREAGYNR